MCHRTVKPFLSFDEYQVTEAVVKDFKHNEGTGRKLQAYLEERAAKHENWVRIQNIFFIQIINNDKFYFCM